MMQYNRPGRVLLVEDNPADMRLLLEAFREAPEAHEIHAVTDGDQALDFVFRRPGYSDKPRPDLILLDINLPKRGGHEVLDVVKGNSDLMKIPVIMLTSSDSGTDVMKAYGRGANAYVRKPTNLEEYFQVASQVTRFWLRVVQLPTGRA